MMGRVELTHVRDRNPLISGTWTSTSLAVPKTASLLHGLLTYNGTR
jgi:hypothetical protein